MTDFSPRDVENSMDVFKAAVTARHQDLPTISAAHLLLVLDGSNQDATAAARAAAIAKRLDAGVTVLHLTTPASPRAVDALSAAGITAAPARGEGHHPWERILTAATGHRCDLVLMPAPCLEDYTDLGTHSVGSVTDIVLARRATPVLIVRAPEERPAVGTIVIPLDAHQPGNTHAVAWALALADAGASLHLVGHVPAAEGEAHEVAPVTGEAADLAGLNRDAAAGLVAAAQRAAVDRNLNCTLKIYRGGPLEVIAHAAKDASLIVTRCPENCSATGFQLVMGMIRQSPIPVLVL